MNTAEAVDQLTTNNLSIKFICHYKQKLTFDRCYMQIRLFGDITIDRSQLLMIC